MKQDELPTPIEIAFYRPGAVVTAQTGELDLLQEFWFMVSCGVLLTP